MRTNGTRIVMIVDSDRDAAATLAMLVIETGHLTRVACDALEAIRIAEEVIPDIILLQVDMPRLDGYAIAGRLRKDRRFDRTLLVAVSASASTVDRQRSMEAGFDDHLMKPVARAAVNALFEAPALQR